MDLRVSLAGTLASFVPASMKVKTLVTTDLL